MVDGELVAAFVVVVVFVTTSLTGVAERAVALTTASGFEAQAPMVLIQKVVLVVGKESFGGRLCRRGKTLVSRFVCPIQRQCEKEKLRI